VSQPLATSTSLFDYFHEHVGDARAVLRSDISDDTALYLAKLLADRGHQAGEPSEIITLAELHAKAAHAPPAEQARTYRELGDTALYSLGYFEESLERRVVGPDYYRDMGAAAYYRVDQVFKRWFADAFGPVFTELSARFEDCVLVITRVRDVNLSLSSVEVLALYERWHRTGSEALAARLRAAGMVLPVGEPSEA